MYIIMEVQANADGTAGTLVYTYDDTNKDVAESKYHSILSSAAVSSVYRHSAFMLTDDGRLLRSECYTHEPEPEPDESEGE